MNRTVVSDSGPLHYLTLIGCADILSQLFHRVLVPHAVRDELTHQNAPPQVKAFLLQPPPWLQIIPVTQPHSIHGLHLGETETLQLALERKADAVLMDERDGRAAAQRLHIPAIYTLAILEVAAQKNLVDLEPALVRLKQTSFFIAPQILTALLDRHRQRQN